MFLIKVLNRRPKTSDPRDAVDKTYTYYALMSNLPTLAYGLIITQNIAPIFIEVTY